MWTGKLQCAPSAPDLRPPSAALHRPKSVIYINSAHIGKAGQVMIDPIIFTFPSVFVITLGIASTEIIIILKEWFGSLFLNWNHSYNALPMFSTFRCKNVNMYSTHYATYIGVEKMIFSVVLDWHWTPVYQTAKDNLYKEWCNSNI